MKRTFGAMSIFVVIGGLLLAPRTAEAQRSRPRAEVIAWTADASLVVFAEPQRSSSGRRTVDLVAREVPGGEVVERLRIFPGPCSRVIERRLAISHGCALSELRPELPRRYRSASFHIAANERGRISQITLRADGSVVEHEIHGINVVIRGRTEEERHRSMAVLEVSRLDGRRARPRILDRRPIRPRARRSWTLLRAGDNHYIIIGRGMIRRIDGHPPESRALPRSDMASSHSHHG